MVLALLLQLRLLFRRQDGQELLVKLLVQLLQLRLLVVG